MNHFLLTFYFPFPSLLRPQMHKVWLTILISPHLHTKGFNAYSSIAPPTSVCVHMLGERERLSFSVVCLDVTY